jgi:hypothetical protein
MRPCTGRTAMDGAPRTAEVLIEGSPAPLGRAFARSGRSPDVRGGGSSQGCGDVMGLLRRTREADDREMPATVQELDPHSDPSSQLDKWYRRQWYRETWWMGRGRTPVRRRAEGRSLPRRPGTGVGRCLLYGERKGAVCGEKANNGPGLARCRAGLDCSRPVRGC